MEQIKGYDSWKLKEPDKVAYGEVEEEVKARKKVRSRVAKQLPFVEVKIDNGQHKELY
jgi:hypothetical protein